MKKTLCFALLLTLLVPCAITSCSDEDSLPNVDYNITISGGVINPENGTIYVVQGDTLAVTSLSVTNNETGKAAAINGAEYYWDYNFIGGSPFPPYGFNIVINDAIATGAHDLTIQCGVLAVDKEPAVGLVNYPVMVVPDSTQLPVSQITSLTQTATLGSK